MYNLESLKVLYEFDVIVKLILSRGNTFDYLKETLKSKGIPVIGSGGFKTVFKYNDNAICMVKGKRGRKERFIRNLQYLIKFPPSRDIFVYPTAAYNSIELDLVYLCMPLCSHDVFEECFRVIDDEQMENVKQLNKSVKRILNFFLKDMFLFNLVSCITEMHQIENDEDGIFNFDIKLENFLVKGDRIYLSDIDGFGFPGKVPRFGTHTDTWCISLHGGRGMIEPSVCTKRLGCLNDIFAIAFLVLYLRLMAFDYKSFIRCYKEASLKTYGSKRKGCFKNSNGQKEMTLKSFFYEKEEDKDNGEKNVVFVQCRIQFIRELFEKYKIVVPEYEQSYKKLILTFKRLETMKFLTSKKRFVEDYYALKRDILMFYEDSLRTFEIEKFRADDRKRFKSTHSRDTSPLTTLDGHCCLNQ